MPQSNKPTPAGLDRRQLMLAAGALGLTAGLPGEAATQTATPSMADPDYRRVPLKKERIRYGIIQSPDIAIDPGNAERERRQNLNRMLELLDKSTTLFSGGYDLISFAEMPLHGFGEWGRKEALQVAAEIPGEETEALGRKARELGTYISFGTYAKDRDWPDHVIMMGVLMGPDGEIAARHWKARGTLGGLGLFTSTVYECLDRYVEMYGWDEVIPVARTDIGNICMTGVQNDPMLFLTMAVKGAELVLRYATGGMPVDDGVAMSKFFKFYTGFANSSRHTDHRYYVGGVGVGQSMIVGPNGDILAQADQQQSLISAYLPMADFRRGHRIPDFQWPLYAPVLAGYQPRFDPGWFLKYLPESWADTRSYFKDKANW